MLKEDELRGLLNKLDNTMERVAEALVKIAVLEEHRQDSKKMEEDIFKRLNAIESKIPVLETIGNLNQSKFTWIERAVMGTIIGGLLMYVFFDH